MDWISLDDELLSLDGFISNVSTVEINRHLEQEMLQFFPRLKNVTLENRIRADGFMHVQVAELSNVIFYAM